MNEYNMHFSTHSATTAPLCCMGWACHSPPSPGTELVKYQEKKYNSNLKMLTKHEIFKELHTLFESIKYTK
jgi:hypothetical protein